MTKPIVELVTATERDPTRAAALLIFTKSTRLAMTGAGLTAIEQRCERDPEWMRTELEYMAKTIRSSWEFLDLIFLTRNVSRACAQQITRTRLASYAMQSQRVTDMSNASYHIPDGLSTEQEHSYDEAMQIAMAQYRRLLGEGFHTEDARGVLPVNLHCSLVQKYNLRVLVDLVQARTSFRTQGEYREVATQMRDLTVRMWPWAEIFFRPRNSIAVDLLEELDRRIQAVQPDAHAGRDLRTLVAKVRDQIEGG